jgi:hypothetical protein
MAQVLLKQDLESSIDRVIKAEQYLNQNIEDLIVNYLNSLKEKFPSLHFILIEISNDYSEEHDAYLGPYVSNCRISLDPSEIANATDYIEKTEGKDFYTSSYSYPLLSSLVFDYNNKNQLLNDDLKEALLEISKIINFSTFTKSLNNYYEFENFQAIYNFDTKSMHITAQ